MPRVSVIIPTYRRPYLLGPAIQSVLNQTFQDFEIVIVDDNSGDDTEQVVSSFRDPRIRYIAHRTNWRVGAARNTGVLNSSAPLVAFLDDDDEWFPDKLRRQVALLDSSARVTGVVYTSFVMVERASGRLIRTIRPVHRGHILHELCRRNCVGTASTVLLRRECFHEVGLFDETIEFGEEYDMWIRVARRYDFEFLPDPMVRYNMHLPRLSTSYQTMINGFERQISKHGSFFATSPKHFSRRFILLGSLYCYQGDSSRARAAFRRAVRIWPWVAKHYGYLGLSVFGAKVFSRVRPRDPRTL
jgi:glycosyltransferase involved in cell wall biosynthesis